MKKNISLPPDRALDIYGPQNCNLQAVCSSFPDLKVVARGSEIKLDGSKEDIERFCEALYEVKGKALENETRISDVIVYSSEGKPIAARGKAQKAMVAAYDYVDWESFRGRAEEKGEAPFVLICESIQDPHNLGAIIRSAECVGAPVTEDFAELDLLIQRFRRQSGTDVDEGTTLRAAAGIDQHTLQQQHGHHGHDGQLTAAAVTCPSSTTASASPHSPMRR